MLVACWSVKGGTGTTVVASALALTAARRASPGSAALLVDLGGDAPGCLGLPEPAGPGLAEWLAAGPDVPPDALARLEVPVAEGLHLLPRGSGPLVAGRAALLVHLLAADGRTVVVDGGRVTDGPTHERLAAAASPSLLVTRLCYLGLRRAARTPVRPSGVVVVREPGRALTVDDAAAVVGAPVVAEVAVDPAVARAVDAGLLTSRLPRGFAETAAAALVAPGEAA